MKLFYFNLDVGGGIQRTGDTIRSMIPEAIEYSRQNPAFIIADELVKNKPDIVIINEAFPRVLEGTYYYYLATKPRVILINHCYSSLLKPRSNNKDQLFLIKHFIRQIDYTMNLDYVPVQIKEPNVIPMYHPCNPKFRLKIPWNERPKNCLYWGNLAAHKFNVEFLDLYKEIDLYGKILKDGEYKDKILESGCYKGYLPEEKLVETINEYKYFVVPHNGYEPFMLTLQEAMQCGTIPLVTNTRNYSNHYWIDWARGLYLEFRNNKSLARWLRAKHDLEQFSFYISNEINKRHNYDRFKRVLWSLIRSDLKWEVNI